jgi:maltooligosyltrehalose trehalohydrolase
VSVQLGVEQEESQRAEYELSPEGNGYFSGFIKEAKDGQRYLLALDSGAFPDPASRFQPEGSHGPSQIVIHRDSRGPTRRGME